MAKEKDGFFQNVNKFFKRVQNQDLIKLSGDHMHNYGAPATEEENKRRSEFSVFRQYLQAKNWSTKHIELFDEYRKMDATYPIIAAALKIYAQEVCLSGDSIVRTPKGDFTIKQLIEDKKANDMFYVQSYNQNWRKTEWNVVYGIKSNGIKQVYEVTVHKNICKDNLSWDKVEKASFKCTDNHKILVDGRGTFKELKHLKVGDSIFSHYVTIDPTCRCKKDIFNNTTILDIQYIGEEEVYDLINVSPNHHFSLKLTESFFIQVHNCTKDTDGNVLKIITDDKDVKRVLKECFFDNLKINSQSYLLVKEFLKFGNLFCFLNTRRGVGVTDLIHLPPEAMRIQLLQNAENLDSFKFHWYGNGGGMHFEPWEVVHFKNIEDIEMQPYGVSILRPVVDTWRRIILLREALIIYRITRAPQRFLYKIDTTGMDPDAALKFAEEMKKSLDKKPLQNPQTGELDWKFNPISITENIYMPTFAGDEGGVEILQGASNLQDLEDYAVIKDDLFAGLLIPKSYLCLKGDTKVKCLDGEDYTILELKEKYEKGEKLYVYSATEKGNIIPGEVEWVGATKKEIKTFKIELDNNEVVECSDGHPWMMRDGSYVRADKLKIGDSIMPLYTKLSKGKYGGYEMVYHNGQDKWQLTHQLVATWKDVDFYKNSNGKIVCHHEKGKRNNHPDFLTRCSQKEHIEFHKELAYKNLCSPESREKNYVTKQTKEYRKKLSDIRKRYFENNANASVCISDTNKLLKKTKNMRQFHKEGIENKTISQFGSNNGNFKGDIQSLDLENLLVLEDITNINELRIKIKEKFPNVRTSITLTGFAAILGLDKETFCDKYGFTYKKTTNKIKSIDELLLLKLIENGVNFRKAAFIMGVSCEMINNYYLNHYKKNFFDYQKENLNNIYFNSPQLKNDSEISAPHNHKIKSITIHIYDEPEQLYDLAIKKYHNFALTAGVFVHNSFEEDLSNKAALCLSGNSNILTNEGIKPIKQIAEEFSQDKKIYALACNKHGMITSGKILNCHSTKLVKELYKVEISNGKFVECTDNHPFLMDNLEYKKADELQVGDKLKGIYEKEYFVRNIEIIILDEEELVYDLEVEEHHNFALECGIFVHNSQEDMRFSNAIKMYQSYFIEGLLHVALVHLHINGFSKDDLASFSLEMNTNSTLAEKTRNELLQQRLDLANAALNDQYGMSLMSYTQVMKEILKFTDEEIAKTFKDQLIEKKMIWRLAQLREQGFYEEPEQEKKKAMMMGMNADDDVFSDIKLEAKEQLPIIKSILMEKIDKEIQYLTRPSIAKPTKRQIDLVLENYGNKLEYNRQKTLKDMGLNG